MSLSEENRKSRTQDEIGTLATVTLREPLPSHEEWSAM